MLVVASFLIWTAKKIYDYAARPVKDKESDFVFAHDPQREKPTVLVGDAQWPPLNFEQRGGFINDASHLNRTAIYGVVRVSNEDDIQNALAFARANKLKPSCAG